MNDNGPFVFPCSFPIKVFGQNDDTFRNHAWQIVENHFGTLNAEQVAENASRSGKFVSITFTVDAQDRASLDNVYQDLSDDPLILMAL